MSLCYSAVRLCAVETGVYLQLIGTSVHFPVFAVVTDGLVVECNGIDGIEAT